MNNTLKEENGPSSDGGVSTSTQNQVSSALLFLYRGVLGVATEAPRGVLRPRKPPRLPIVLSRDEAAAIVAELTGTKRLVAATLYGSGLRLMEALRLRVKDVDLDRNELSVRSGKGGHDRRHHLHESAVQRAVTEAVHRSALTKRASCHSFRHSFATHLLEDGYDIRTVQELLGPPSITRAIPGSTPRVLRPGGGAKKLAERAGRGRIGGAS